MAEPAFHDALAVVLASEEPMDLNAIAAHFPGSGLLATTMRSLVSDSLAAPAPAMRFAR